MPLKKAAVAFVPTASPTASPITPRLLRILDASRYLSSTPSYVETLIREKQIVSFIVGKRRVICKDDLDRHIDKLRAEASAA